MSEDDYTRPEFSTEMKQARVRWEKRYKAIVDKKGICCVCINRDREQTFWGRNVCRVGQHRMYPQCQTDGKAVSFAVDATAVEEYKDAA